MNIQTKRVYDPITKRHHDYRILVDRLWPRGMTEDDAQIDLWLKEIAPSTELRKWFNHDPEKWHEFKKRYFAELTNKEELLTYIIEKSHTQPITLLYSAEDEKYNNALALQEYLTQY
jgi:uncharacterized protein YeaO (DUF488 family)